MPFLAALLGSLAGFLTQWMTKKAAMGVAALGSIFTLTLAFWLALKSAMQSVLVAAPALCEITWLIPSNAAACIAVVVSATVVKAVYDWHIQNIKVLSSIT